MTDMPRNALMPGRLAPQFDPASDPAPWRSGLAPHPDDVRDHGTMRAYEPRVPSDNISYMVRDVASGLGADDATANWYANRLQQVAPWVPPIAALDAAGNIGREANQGNYGRAAGYGGLYVLAGLLGKKVSELIPRAENRDLGIAGIIDQRGGLSAMPPYWRLNEPVGTIKVPRSQREHDSIPGLSPSTYPEVGSNDLTGSVVSLPATPRGAPPVPLDRARNSDYAAAVLNAKARAAEMQFLRDIKGKMSVAEIMPAAGGMLGHMRRDHGIAVMRPTPTDPQEFVNAILSLSRGIRDVPGLSLNPPRGVYFNAKPGVAPHLFSDGYGADAGIRMPPSATPEEIASFLRTLVDR